MNEDLFTPRIKPIDKLLVDTITTPAQRQKRVYIAGPMSDMPDYNFPAFNEAARRLTEAGYDVENPADHGLVENASRFDYLRYDIIRLASCSKMLLLPGWKKSEGTAFELSIAAGLNIEIFENLEVFLSPQKSSAVGSSLLPVDVNVAPVVIYCSDEACAQATSLYLQSKGYANVQNVTFLKPYHDLNGRYVGSAYKAIIRQDNNYYRIGILVYCFIRETTTGKKALIHVERFRDGATFELSNDIAYHLSTLDSETYKAAQVL